MHIYVEYIPMHMYLYICITVVCLLEQKPEYTFIQQINLFSARDGNTLEYITDLPGEVEIGKRIFLHARDSRNIQQNKQDIILYFLKRKWDSLTY